jgi:hypothetical protein
VPSEQQVRNAPEPSALTASVTDLSDGYAMSEDTYFRERTSLVEMEQKSADQHDKAILTLTAGALGLSLTFIDRIAPNPAANTLWVVGTAWIAFILSIFAILASFLTSQSACRRQRELLDSEYSTGEPPEETNNFADATRYLNVAAYSCFLLGVVFLASFSWVNLGKANHMSNEQTSPSVQNSSSSPKEERGNVPPKLPAKPSTATNAPKPTK